MPHKRRRMKTGRLRKREEKLKVEGWIIVLQRADFSELSKKTAQCNWAGRANAWKASSTLTFLSSSCRPSLCLCVLCTALCCSEGKPGIKHSVSIYLYLLWVCQPKISFISDPSVNPNWQHAEKMFQAFWSIWFILLTFSKSLLPGCGGGI